MLAGALLAACAPLVPPERGLPGMAQDWPSDTADGANDFGANNSGANQVRALPGWRGYFTDPELRTLIERALAGNADLKLALARVQEARAGFGAADAALWPQLDAAATLDRGLVPADLNLTRKPLLGSQYQIGAQLGSWELDLWGRLRSLRGAAQQRWLASDEARHAVALLLVAQVADGYLGLRELDERRALAQRAIDSRNASWHMFKRRYEVGSMSRLEVVQAETLLTQAQALGAQLDQARAACAHALAELVGANGELQLASAGVPLELPPLAAGLPSELLLARPDLRAAEHQLRAARANIDAARAAYFPRIGLTSAFGTASAELDGLFAGGSRAWTIAPAAGLNLFDGGRRDAGLAAAQAQRDAVLADYERRIHAAFREVADALSARRTLASQLEIAGRACAAQAERARLAQLRYARGATTYLEVLDAERDLLAVEQQRVQVRRALQSSQVALYAALGGAGEPAAATPLMKDSRP